MSDTTSMEQETHDAVQTEAPGSDDVASATPEEHGSGSAAVEEAATEPVVSSEDSDGDDSDGDGDGDD